MFRKINFLGVFLFSVLIFTLTGCSSRRIDDSEYSGDYVTEEAEEGTHTPLPLIEIPPVTELVPYVRTFDYVLQNAYLRRLQIFAPTIEDLLPLTAERVDPITDVSSMERRIPRQRTVTSEDAAYDVNLFFSILRERYGGYTYFGGDAVFSPVFSEVLDRILEEAYWDIREFEAFVHASLTPYINDGHGWVYFGNYRFMPHYNVYISTDKHFYATAEGFVCAETNLLVSEIVGHNYDDIMQLSTNANGEIFYIIAIDHFSLDEGNLSATVLFENGVEQVIELTSTSLNRPRRSGLFSPSLRLVEGIPVIRINQMHFETANANQDMEYALVFLSFVEEVRDYPAIIIDLRTNGGGNGYLAPRWLYRLLGEAVPANHLILRVTDYERFQEQIEINLIDMGGFFFQPMCEIRSLEEHAKLDSNHAITFPTGTKAGASLIENNQLIVFLTSNSTQSAAELFVDLGFNMQNTLVIGQNTGGLLLTQSAELPRLYLPHTGISFGFGTGIMIHAEAHNWREGVGLYPDLWVQHPDDALPAAIALLKEHLGV